MSTRMNRRLFSAGVGALPMILASRSGEGAVFRAPGVRLGGPIFDSYTSPQEWIAAMKRNGYSAAYCPVGADASDDVCRGYEDAATEADIVIAEVGAWSNPISLNDEERVRALEKCKTQLHLADRIGALCCVNISGSMGEKWDGHDARNFTPEAFDRIVDSVREIVDEVNPIRTVYSLETMPWAYPDSADSYLRLIRAIDRKAFAVHFDPVNLICSPQRYYSNAELIRENFLKLGPYMKSCHGKDILLHQELTTHLDEVRPGLGVLDYKTFLQELRRWPGVPLMLEHLPNAEEYTAAANHIRSVAADEGVALL